MNDLHDFHARGMRGMFGKCLNATFISLIPKKLGAIDITPWLKHIKLRRGILAYSTWHYYNIL
jgi:hypothetical protein